MTKRTTKIEGPHPVDVHVGHRLRYRRAELGVSQTKLGDRIGITFQQIQKYEKGANRISASMLFEIAHVLGVSIGYFFKDLPDGERGEAGSIPLLEKGSDLAATIKGQRVLQAISNLPAPIRIKVSALVIALSAGQENEEDKPDEA